MPGTQWPLCTKNYRKIIRGMIYRYRRMLMYRTDFIKMKIFRTDIDRKMKREEMVFHGHRFITNEVIDYPFLYLVG